MNDAEAAAYLAAFIDGEGHINFCMTSRNRSTKAIAFTNTNKQLFDRVVALATQLNLHFRVYHRGRQRPHWSDTWVAYLRGGRQAFDRFHQIIPLQCAKKKQTLRDMVNSYCSQKQLDEIISRRRTSVLCKCKVCNKEFHAFPADLKRNHGKYCSRECGYKGRAKRIEKVCQTCGSNYLVNPAREASRFCSQRCQGLSRADKMRSMAKMAADVRWGH